MALGTKSSLKSKAIIVKILKNIPGDFQLKYSGD